MDCQGRKVIITGGSSGYGYGMAKILKQRGAEVLITGRRLQVLEQAAQELGVAFVQADVCNPDDWDRIFEANGPRLDVLINNAGAAVRIAPLVESSDEEIIRSINTNLTGVLLGCKRAARVMIAQKSGLIINVSSVCAHYGWPGWTTYTAGKAGVDRLSRALYTELRPHKVRVTVLTPSWGATDFLKAAKLSDFDQETLQQVMTGEQMGEIVAGICESPDNLCYPEIMVQPLVQEIIPF